MRWRDEKKWKNPETGEINEDQMNKDMTIMFKAVDKHYKMPMQYKYTWNTLQNFGQFRDKRIWKNFEYLIDWMEEHFPKKKFFEIMGKSYDLEDSILYRIIDEKSTKTESESQKDKKGIVESWLMSNIFRHVENPDKNNNPTRKYTGKVRFQKVSYDFQYLLRFGKFEKSY